MMPGWARVMRVVRAVVRVRGAICDGVESLSELRRLAQLISRGENLHAKLVMNLKSSQVHQSKTLRAGCLPLSNQHTTTKMNIKAQSKVGVSVRK